MRKDSNYPPDWDKRRRTVFKRDQWECRGCGHVPDKKRNSGLHAHHVTPISEGGSHSLDNLMTLCEDCHHEVHSNAELPNLEPVEYYDCAQCDGGKYRQENCVGGSFCSEECLLRHKAEKALNSLKADNTICSTCFSHFPRGENACPQCGNWDPQQNNRGNLDVDELDAEHLVMRLLKHEHLT